MHSFAASSYDFDHYKLDDDDDVDNNNDNEHNGIVDPVSWSLRRSAATMTRADIIEATLEHDRSPAVVRAYSGYNYVGCYSDTGSHVYRTKLATPNNSVEACLDTAKTAGYNAVGIEFKGEWDCATAIAWRGC